MIILYISFLKIFICWLIYSQDEEVKNDKKIQFKIFNFT